MSISPNGKSTDDSSAAFELPPHIFEEVHEGLVDNPLLRLRNAEVGTYGKKFARAFQMANLEGVFERAAKVARDPLEWQSVPGLTADERQAISDSEDEGRHFAFGLLKTNGFWGQPKQLQVTIITLCVAAVVQGWNQTASNGANLQWPIQLGLPDAIGCDQTSGDAWKFAVVNAATYLAASLVGCWLSDPLSESFAGRRAPICISAILILASMIGCALTKHWTELLGCRILLGIGMGCKATMVPVFAAEVAPAHIRGSLVMNWQLFDALGIFLGFSANLILATTGAHAWRWQTASSVLPTIILLTLIYVVPESPRFLMKRGRYPAAYQTLVLLRGHSILAAKELFYVHCQMEVEKHAYLKKDPEANSQAGAATRHVRPSRGRPTYLTKLGQLFTVPRTRRAMMAAGVCMISQQLCGVNVLAFYSSTIFYNANNQKCATTDKEIDMTALWLSWGIGLSYFVFAFPAYRLIDSRGRRWLLLVTLPFLALTMLAAGLSFLIPASNPAHAPVIGTFLFIFTFFYSWGMGPVPFTLSAEVFPLENRVVGMSVAVFTNLFGAGLLTLFVPALTNAIGHAGLLGIFAALNVLAFGLVFLFVRETAGAAIGSTLGGMFSVSLEELNYIFEVTTTTHREYQFRVMIPWFFRNLGKLIMLREVQVPEKCYNWAREREEQEEDEGEKQPIEEEVHEIGRD
ncbi:MFS transporter [Hortaea werneckii]|nr:MFS transporter [Hortaea werneckii]